MAAGPFAENDVDDATKVVFAKSLAFGNTPADLPKRYVEAYERACRLVRLLHSNHEPRPSDKWIIVMMAEMNHELEQRIAALEALLPIGKHEMAAKPKMKAVA